MLAARAAHVIFAMLIEVVDVVTSEIRLLCVVKCELCTQSGQDLPAFRPSSSSVEYQCAQRVNRSRQNDSERGNRTAKLYTLLHITSHIPHNYSFNR